MAPRNDLAAAAPKVEPAVASSAEREAPATVETVQQVQPAQAEAAPAVEPAVAEKVAPEDDDTPTTPLPEKKPSQVSVEALRGHGGADFESYAAVLRGAPEKNCLKMWLPCFFDERDFISYGEVRKYALIKASSCFIFMEETDLSPLYAILLDEVYAFPEDPNKPEKTSITVSPSYDNKQPKDYVTILLKYKNDNRQAYQFTFDTSKDSSVAKRFLDAVENAGASKKGTVTVSVFQAKEVAKQAVAEQPAI